MKRLLPITVCNVSYKDTGSDTPHILDLVISNDSFIDEVKHLAPLGKSDHSVLCVECSLRFNYRPVYKMFRYNKGNYVSLKQCLDIDWDSAFEPCSSDIDAMWNLFKDIIIKTHEFIQPIRVFQCPINRK